MTQTPLARLLAATALALAATAHAAPDDKPAAATLDERIAQGEQDGSLTEKESRKLHREMDKIHELEREAAARGGATIKEQKKIDKLREEADQDVTDYKHNDKGVVSKTH